MEEHFNSESETNIEKRASSKSMRIWLPLILGVCVALGIVIGNFLGSSSQKGNLFVGRKPNKVDVLLEYIDKQYVDSVNVNDLVEAAIPAIISELDPHSSYITKEDMLSVGTELEGHFGGIGVEFIIKDDTINIVNVTMGGPSEALGLMSGDKIISVNDSVFAGIGLSNMKVVKTLRGPKGTKVKLGVKRATSPEELIFDVTRADVKVNTIDAHYIITPDIGYVKLGKFGATSFSEFISAVGELKKQGAKSFILDLQDNTGGYLDAAYLLTNEFLHEGDLIVYTEGKASPRADLFAKGRGILENDPVVVLINEQSASASEIFAGAIQDHDRGLILGRRSFGKGLVQRQIELSDSSAVRITIARYHTPSGRSIQKPYVTGSRDDYDLDILHRYENGEFYSLDSLKIDDLPQYITDNGRTVYGNMAIMPDVFIPRDTLGINAYFIKVSNSGVLRDFSFKYASDNKEKLKAMGSWEKAYEYLTTQNLVDQMAEFAETKKIRKRPVLINEARNKMKQLIEALIIRDVFSDQSAFYYILQQDDPVILKAVEFIHQGKATPEAVAEELYLFP